LTSNLEDLICDFIEFLKSEFVEEGFDFSLYDFGGKTSGFGTAWWGT
jgi:hypothetical protein